MDTVLGVYTGTIGTLVKTDDDDDATDCAGGYGSNGSRVTFAAVAGTEYKVDVTGFRADRGSFYLRAYAGGTQPRPTPDTGIDREDSFQVNRLVNIGIEEPGVLSGPRHSASFKLVSDSAGATFECALDGAAFSACTSPVAYEGLAPGSSHTFRARAIAAGSTDPTPIVERFTIDTTPPETFFSKTLGCRNTGPERRMGLRLPRGTSRPVNLSLRRRQPALVRLRVAVRSLGSLQGSPLLPRRGHRHRRQLGSDPGDLADAGYDRLRLHGADDRSTGAADTVRDPQRRNRGPSGQQGGRRHPPRRLRHDRRLRPGRLRPRPAGGPRRRAHRRPGLSRISAAEHHLPLPDDADHALRLRVERRPDTDDATAGRRRNAAGDRQRDAAGGRLPRCRDPLHDRPRRSGNRLPGLPRRRPAGRTPGAVLRRRG